MTEVTLRNEAANIRELSLNDLDQVTAGHSGNDAVPAMMLIAAGVAVLTGFVAGVLRSLFGKE